MKPTPAQLAIYAATFVIWSLLCFAHFYLMTTAMLAGSHDGDSYSYSWSFQGVIFAMFCLPLWIAFLGFVIWLEARFFLRKGGQE